MTEQPDHDQIPVRRAPDEWGIRVRFTEEPEDWIYLLEHSIKPTGEAFPCTGKSECPGCYWELPTEAHYLANAVELQEAPGNEPRLARIVLQMKKDLACQIVVGYEEWGTITDRTLEIRSSKGDSLANIREISTSVEQGLSQFEPADLMAVLEGMLALSRRFEPNWYGMAGFTMTAAAQFVSVAFEMRKDLTYLAPRDLAAYLRRGPDLRGDDELPDAIDAAVDALEALPNAVLDWRAPDHYEGEYPEFLADADRVFRSVTKRLQRLMSLNEGRV